MGQDGEKLEPSNTAGRNENGTATLENILNVLGNIKNRVIICLSNCTYRHNISKRNGNLFTKKKLAHQCS